jgi:hypothetical protein
VWMHWAPVATVTARHGNESEKNGPIVNLQAMECSSTPPSQ